MAKKKIIFIIDRLQAGAGRVVYDLVKGLSGFEVVVVSLYKEGELVDNFKKLGVEVIFAGKEEGKSLSLIFKLKRIIKKEKPAVVHTHNVDGYEYGVLAAWLAGVDKIIHTSHGKSVKESWFKRKRENVYHKFVSLFLDDYICVSDDLGKYVKKTWCLNNKKVKTIYNGIDTEKYKPKKVKKEIKGVGEDDFLVGVVAGLREVKDHQTLIKSMEKVVKEVPKAKLIVVGDGPQRKKLADLVKELDLEDKILFLGHRDNVVELFNVFDVAVLSSLSECLSITLLEGMSCGVPFVATDVGGNGEVVDNGVDSFLVSKRNEKQMADKIIWLLKHEKERKEMGERSREKVKKKFTVEGMVNSYKKLYSD